MKNEKLISVVMGIYNCAGTLREAVNCIINQTYTNWELIMCDDGSTDDTYKVALDLANTDQRIKLLKNDFNMTLAPTLNRCIECAKGEYIARMDGDDVCSSDRFQIEYDFLENNKEYAFVSSWMQLFDDSGIYRTVKYIEYPSCLDLVKRSQFCHASSMMRVDKLKEIGCYSADKIHNRVEDYHLWIKFYQNGYKGYNIQQTLYSMHDDRNAYKRRTIKNRLNEANLQLYICKKFKLNFRYIVYPILTILKAFVPKFIYDLVHKNI